MAAKKATPKATTPRVKNAEFVIFDRTLQGAITVDRIKTPLLENGLIAKDVMETLETHDSMRNRTVQCVNDHAMTLWRPMTQSQNQVLTPPIIQRSFELVVEEGVEVSSLPFKLRDEFKVEIKPDTLKNMLRGKTHKHVKVTKNLRAKYAKMMQENPPKESKGGTPVETRLAIILKVMGGTSGGEVAKEYNLTSSTVNTMARQFRGKYRDGNPISIDKLPPWVPKVRELLKEKLEEGGHDVDDEFKAMLGLD